MSFLANRNVQIFNSTMSVSTLNTSAMAISTLTGSTLNASSINVSTLSGSTLTASTMTGNQITISTLTVSSINNGAPGVAEYSTLNVSSLNATSTITASTLNVSTLNTNNTNFSTLTGSTISVSSLTASTLSVSTMTGSTLTISMLTGLIISASSLSVSSITSSDLVLSTLTVSSINGLAPGTGGSGGSGGTTIFSTLGVSSLNVRSTITTSTLLATGNVGIGSNTPAAPLDVSGQIRTATTATNCVMAMTSGNGSFGSIESFNSGNTSKLPVALNAYGGNVGIGITNPSHTLQVAGAINCTSFLVNGTAVATGTGSVWGVNGSSAYYTSGNVGIGTITPPAKFSVIPADGTTNYGLLSFINSNGYGIYVNTTAIGSRGNTLDWYSYDYNFGAITARPILTMRPEGYISIGSTDTQSNMLRIFGGNATSGISLGDYMTSAGVKYIGITAVSNGTSLGPSSGFSGITFGSPYDGGGTSGYLAFHTHGYGISSDERMRIDKGGRVGIGKTNPSQLLDVNGAINCTSFLVNGTAVATGTGSVWGVSGSTAYYTSGNVGISTTAAITNLHVRVPTYSSPVFIVDAGGQGTDITPPRGIGKPLIGVGAYSWSNVSSGDYYGIGFGYNANNNAASYYAGEIGFLVQTTAGGEYGDLVFSTRPTTTNTTIASERMRITSAGNVGIGTTVAAQTLSLYGTMGITSASGVYNSFFIKSSSTATDYASMYFVNNTPVNAYMGLGGSGVGGNFQNNFFIQSPNAIAFNTNSNGSSGTNTMYLTSTGNVGIGTVSPAYKLVVQTATANYGIVHTDGTISLSTWVGTSGATGAWLGTMTNHDLQFFTNAGVSRMTINTSGQVGIGTITPGSKLHIYSTTANDGLVFQNAFNSSTGSIKLYTTTAAGNFIIDGTADAGVVLPTDGKDLFFSRNTSLYTSMVVKGGTGYVGIGTATPNGTLQVGHCNTAGGVSDGTVVVGTNNGSSSRQFKMGYDSGSTYNFAFGDYGHVGAMNTWVKQFQISYGAPANSLYINSSANVGIGTVPATTLHTYQLSTNVIRMQSSGPDNAYIAATPDYIFISANYTIAGGRDNVGRGSAQIALYQPQAGGIIIFNTSPSIDTAVQERMRIISNGYVGIGITNPVASLHVYGSNNTSGGQNTPVALTNSNAPTLRWDVGPNVNSDFCVYYSGGGCLFINHNSVSSGWIYTSDLRLKDDIVSIQNCVDTIDALRPVSYRMKSNMDSQYKTFGLIAQEVKEVLPELVSSIPDEEHGETYGITYNGFIPILIGAVKELSKKNTALEEQLATILARLDAAGIA